MQGVALRTFGMNETDDCDIRLIPGTSQQAGPYHFPILILM